MVTGTVMAGAFFGNLADTMKENREYLKAKQGMLQDYMLKAGFEERAKLKEARAERAKLLDEADKLGIDEEAAAVLYSTGQLSSTVGYLKKIEQSEDPDKKINKAGLKRFSEAIVGSVPEEKLGAAMKYAFELGAAEDPSSDKLVEAIHATSLDEYDEAISAFMNTSPTTRVAPNISPFDINKRGLIDYDPADIKAARELIDANLKTQLETTTNPNTGQLQYTNPDASGEILNNAVDFYVNEMSDSLKSRSGAEVIKDIFERVDTLTEDPSIDLRDIAENFKTFEIPPPFQGPMPLSPKTAEEIIKKNIVK
tara:strand:- start:3233 stop:4165 length:933 start_codon:yes stop_codon:yes gene_type:complete